ncbi:MAG: hypothetical protein H0V93_07430 [Euzebyales bacterium]|nr:hypothetical protein [Euzebyales bacterium]
MVVGAALAVSAFTGVVWNVLNVSLRQRIVPDALLGRVSSSMRLLAWGAIPVGAALGGLLTEWGNLVITYLVIGSGYLLMVPVVIRFLSSLNLNNPDGTR